MLDDTLIIGLFVGWILYFWFDYIDELRTRFVDWWWERVPIFEGKPFSCPVCMGFWLSIITWAINIIIFWQALGRLGESTIWFAILGVFGSSIIALIIESLMKRLNTEYL